MSFEIGLILSIILQKREVNRTIALNCVFYRYRGCAMEVNVRRCGLKAYRTKKKQYLTAGAYILDGGNNYRIEVNVFILTGCICNRNKWNRNYNKSHWFLANQLFLKCKGIELNKSIYSAYSFSLHWNQFSYHQILNIKCNHTYHITLNIIQRYHNSPGKRNQKEP